MYRLNKHKADYTRSWKSFSRYISWRNTNAIWPHLLQLSIIRRKEQQSVFLITVMVIWVITFISGRQKSKILWRMHVPGFTWEWEGKESMSMNLLHQQVMDGNVFSRIILISFQKISTYEHLSLFFGRAVSLNFLRQNEFYLITHSGNNFIIYKLGPIT
jgi:hypothetical protein